MVAAAGRLGREKCRDICIVEALAAALYLQQHWQWGKPPSQFSWHQCSVAVFLFPQSAASRIEMIAPRGGEFGIAFFIKLFCKGSALPCTHLFIFCFVPTLFLLHQLCPDHIQQQRHFDPKLKVTYESLLTSSSFPPCVRSSGALFRALFVP